MKSIFKVKGNMSDDFINVLYININRCLFNVKQNEKQQNIKHFNKTTTWTSNIAGECKVVLENFHINE